MKKTVLTLSLVTVFTLLFARNSGVGTVLGQDRTGSPVGLSTQCGACHGGGSSVPTIAIRMLDTAGNQVSNYEPGQTYTYEVELSAAAGFQYGFQSVGLISSTNATAGNLTALSPNAKVITMNGRKYGEQISKSPSGLFQMQWTAPATNVGNITFYAAGVAVNANNSSSGDRAATATPLVLSQSSLAGIYDNPGIQFSAFPNPCTENVQIQPDFSGRARVDVYDLSGHCVYMVNFTAVAGQPVLLDAGTWKQGSYVLHVYDVQNEKAASIVIIKK